MARFCLEKKMKLKKRLTFEMHFDELIFKQILTNLNNTNLQQINWYT